MPFSFPTFSRTPHSPLGSLLTGRRTCVRTVLFAHQVEGSLARRPLFPCVEGKEGLSCRPHEFLTWMFFLPRKPRSFSESKRLSRTRPFLAARVPHLLISNRRSRTGVRLNPPLQKKGLALQGFSADSLPPTRRKRETFLSADGYRPEFQRGCKYSIRSRATVRPSGYIPPPCTSFVFCMERRTSLLLPPSAPSSPNLNPNFPSS